MYSMNSIAKAPISNNAPFVETEMTVAESLQRSRERKKRRIDINLMVVPKGALSCVHKCLSSPAYSELAKCLLAKMLSTGLIDDCTEPLVIQCVAEHATDLLAATFQCKDGNGFDLIRNNIDSSKYSGISDVLRSNYSSLNDSEEKCIYWTLCSAFLVMYYEVHSDLIFDIPLSFTTSDFEKFLRRYPEFLLRTWDTCELLTFQLCMKRAVQCFGNGNNMGCLTELVTRIVKGRETALTCNTSGGGLRNYDHPTEVSTEKCRILIYQRESGILPRTRKSRGSKRKFVPGDVSASINMPIVPGINAPRSNGLDMMPSAASMYSSMGPEAMYHAGIGQLAYGRNSYCPPSQFPQNYDMYGRGMPYGSEGIPYGGDVSYGQVGMPLGMDHMYAHQQPPHHMIPPPVGYDMMNNYPYGVPPMGGGNGYMQNHSAGMTNTYGNMPHR